MKDSNVDRERIINFSIFKRNEIQTNSTIETKDFNKTIIKYFDSIETKEENNKDIKKDKDLKEKYVNTLVTKTSSKNNEVKIQAIKVRHGFKNKDLEKCNTIGENIFYMHYTAKRHETCGIPRLKNEKLQDWRMRERLKTVSAALCICMNIGVDPPDIVKTTPCAKLECWIDPFSLPSQKSLEAIGKNLQQQYETLSTRTRYKQYLDPSIEETKKFCSAQRRNAKDERILFHYNGHGVPRPTESGEIWVFNKNYTQYIPISLYDLQTWLGSPCLYVYDCSAAGNILINFNKFAEQRDAETQKQRAFDSTIPISSLQKESIQLAACGPREWLPMNPDLPADLFTCCLTSPIEIAVRWFVLQNPFLSNITIDMVMRIPGRLQDRRTPLGELNWIFTAITDTIAWNILPKPLFKKLFRQDLMVAALFRNFLLAERIMRVHQCHPMSYPSLPPTYHHPMWNSWDLAVDTCLAQLPQLLEAENGGPAYEYKHSTFFREQLTAFEVWLEQGSVFKKAPDQLPIVLQVLLSQVHRLGALILLSRFLDLGPWAVNLALSIGIFPYVLKLLQSPASELKPVLIFIWTRILAVDGSCQSDLLKDDGYSYFVQILSPSCGNLSVANVSEHRAMCTFILSIFSRNFTQGQTACLNSGVLQANHVHLRDKDPLLRQWSCLCISQIWKDFSDAKLLCIKEGIVDSLCDLLSDPVPEVRAASLFALTTFLSHPIEDKEVIAKEDYVVTSVLNLSLDGSNLVRKELIVFLSRYVSHYNKKIMVTAFEHLMHEFFNFGLNDSKFQKPLVNYSTNSLFLTVWKTLLLLTVDPFLEVELASIHVVNKIYNMLIKSQLGSTTKFIVEKVIGIKNDTTYKSKLHSSTNENIKSTSFGTQQTPSTSKLTNTLKCSTSIALSLKNLKIGTYNEASALESNLSFDEDIHHRSANHHSTLIKPFPKNFNLKFYKSSKHIIQSTFFDWSCEYFQEPQMKPAEADEPGSVNYNQRLWRRNRNEKIINEACSLKDIADSLSWSNQICNLKSGFAQISHLLFHQFESHLICTDDQDNVEVWDWESGIKLNQFSNNNTFGARITGIKFINEDDIGYILVGSSDGIIRIYKNYDTESIELVTAWRALTDIIPLNRGNGLVIDWQQKRGILFVGGEAEIIKIWDTSQEMCLNNISTKSRNCITSITSDEVDGNIFVASFGDGTIRIYDQRNSPRDAIVRIWKEHKTWIPTISMQKCGNRELVSGSISGDVKLWDIRLDNSIRTINTHSDGLRSLSVHEHIPCIATGSTNSDLKVWNTDGSNLSAFKYYYSFLHQGKPTSVNALNFHPHKAILACANGNDSHINIFTCDIGRNH
ncbi:hypothetical protein PNEG_00838 [Pneumocystis murina B123]|uniref:Raptor N-terminal CASPase-like domain-containing protein n=1 Tax=Pneumocystis murina (strain B123) TaxID=1069680 RepID=M7NTT9_PNEMU|nr:hypothetical protein PNEG_00838 [Pneumocystis murina B123]EMR10687.1 hypothetical protein PNEG_00838 [Pneumocystis murina B123]